MKLTQTEKLYKKLTPHELAALCFEAAVRCDESEVDIIIASIERRTYTCTDADYIRRCNSLFLLGFYYGRLYWRSRAMLMTAVHVNDESVCPLRDVAMQLSSMNAAIIEVCKRFKVDPDALKKFAECPDEPTFEHLIDPDTAKVEAYILELERIGKFIG